MNSLPKGNSIQQQPLSQPSLTEPSEYRPENSLLGTIQELRAIQTETAKGLVVLYDSECKLADAEYVYEITLQKAFLNASGTVADRQAISRLEAAEARLKADLAKAEHNRVKQKLKHLELAQMSTQTQSRLLETELKVLK